MSEQKEYPEYLYHYTNLDTLALILKNRSIRMNSLSNMDDVQEKAAADLKSAGKIIYVSSWTDQDKESIPMWKMYASLDNGIRIKLPAIPFKKFLNTPDTFKTRGIPINDQTKDGQYAESYILVAEMMQKGFMSPSVFMNSPGLLNKVIYTDDESKLYPNIIEADDKETRVHFNMIGKFKNDYWSFQNEWRYIMQVFPFDIKNPNLAEAQVHKFMADLLNGSVSQPFPYFDLTIDDSAFSRMEITLAPCMNQAKHVIVEALIEKYNPSCVISESALTGLIND